MDLKTVMNSPGMWLACSFTVLMVVLQSIIFLREAFKEAKRIELDRSLCVRGLRSAMITAVGPSLAPVVILFALVAVLGAPNTWMRLNDIGAARTELAMATMAAQVAGVDLRSPAYDVMGFSYSLWGMALNDVGYLIVALLIIHRLSGAVKTMGTKTDSRWVKLLMVGAVVGLYSGLLSGQLVGVKNWLGNAYAAAIASAVTLLISRYVSKKYPILQEPALGIAIIVGMLGAAALV
jgi:hypothetical protein